MIPFYEKKGTDIHLRKSKLLGCAKHLHDHIELAFADDKCGILCEGHAFIAFPNQVHYYVDEFGEFEHVLFIFPSNKLPAFNKIFLKKIPIQPIVEIELEKILPLINIALEAEKSKGYYY